ncbi:MAG: hypothetical protein GX081_03330 [Firmicutes bacterium]|nr:hypothetical protein [Bacillota bacterium]
MEVKTVQLISFIKPQHKRWVALVFFLCWAVPFLGILGFSIFVPAPAAHRTKAAKTAVTTERSVPAADQSGGALSAEREKTSQSPPPAPPVRQEQQQTPASTPSTAANPATNRQPDPVDLHLLARVIYAEARGEPLEGQVAVGAVLINRVKNPNFPDDLWSVVFKKGEFCTVRDGQIWLQPDATAYRAARLAKAGWDPTNGALYFYNPGKTTSAWIWSRTVTTRIGRHVFAV